MNQKERVLAAIARQEVDHVPSLFSLHFPADITDHDAIVQAHLDFFRRTGCDVSKIMNENLVPLAGELNNPADWDKVAAFDRHAPFMQKQLRLVEDIMAQLSPDSYAIATMHGITASAIHPFEARYGYVPIREMFCRHLREDPRPVAAAMDRIADGMIDYARACMALGVDGIYYASLGGERHFFTDEEFAAYIAPVDLKIMRGIREAGGQVFLHICKEDLNMERYRAYGPLADVVNWGVYEAPYGLEDGRRLFPDSAILGGLANRSGVLVHGTDEELTQAVRDIIRGFGKKGFLLGADCTLPTEIPYEKIAVAVQAAVME